MLKKHNYKNCMFFLSKYRKELIVSIIIVILYFFLRLIFLANLPIFTDEAIYIRWSQIARYDSESMFISLTDGKQPSFIWLTSMAMRLINDPLIAGRLVSVCAGFFTLLGLFFLGKEIFKNTWVGIFSSFLYLIFPMSLVYDRMALYDSLVGAFVVWALYFEILLVRYLRLDIALILSMIIGGGVLTKTSAFFSLYLLPFSLFLFNFKDKARFSKFMKWGILAGIAVILSYAYYSVLRLSPLFHTINEKNGIFVYSLNEWVTHPFSFFVGNINELWSWFIKYTTWPILVLMVFSLFIVRDKTKEKLLLFVWFIVPFIALAFFGRMIYPRFIFFMIISLLPLAALSLVELFRLIKNKIVFIIIAILFFVFALRTDYFIVTDLAKASIPDADLGQYISGWPAGGGIKEIINFLEQEAKKGKIYVASEGIYGSLPTSSVEIYLGDNKNVERRGIWPIPSEMPEDLVRKSKKMSVFFISYQMEKIPSTWPLTLISQYRKGTSNVYTSLYQVKIK